MHLDAKNPQEAQSCTESISEIAGKLQHASLEILSGRSLFIPLDIKMRGDPDFITITPNLRQRLKDWRCLVHCMANDPTSEMQLIMRPPSHISYTDSCKLNTRGVWCSVTSYLKPFL